MAIPIAISGIFPGFAGLFSQGVLQLASRFGSVTIAGALANTFLRTAGWLQNTFPDLPGPVFGLGGGIGRFPGRVLPRPGLLFFPFLGSFLSGFAYRNFEEVKTGWLSFFGELLLSPVVEGNLETATKALGRGDVAGVFNAWGAALADEVGLETLSAFFRGVGTATADIEKATGFKFPPNMLGEAVIWLDGLFRAFGDLLGFARPGRPGAPPLPLDPAFRNRLAEIARDAERKGGKVREVARATRRIIRSPFIRQLIGLAKGRKGALTEKLLRLVPGIA